MNTTLLAWFQKGALNAPLIKDPIQVRFEAYDKANPHVYRALKDLALQAKANGHTRLSIKLLFERVRWYYIIERNQGTGKDDFLLNNSYTSLYARKLMGEEPALKGFFETRRRG